MKRLLTILFVVISANYGLAQSNDLLGTWYLEYMLFGDVEIHTMGGVNPYIVFEGASAPYQMTGNGGCNDFMGTLNYNSNNESYVINSFLATSNSCTSPVDQIENLFFNFFMITGQEYSYDVFVDTEGEEVLHIEFFPIGDTAEFRRTPPLSIAENDTFNPAIAPNPVQDMLHISSEMSQIETLAIYDVSGSTVLHSRAFNGALDVSALSSGIYFLEIRSAKDRSIQKFIKK